MVGVATALRTDDAAPKIARHTRALTAQGESVHAGLCPLPRTRTETRLRSAGILARLVIDREVRDAASPKHFLADAVACASV
jgi:hypothetical protein